MTEKNNHDVKALLQQIQLMSGVLDNIGSYVYSKDLAGKYTYANADVAKLFNTPVQDIIGKDDSHFFDFSISNELRENDLKVIRDKAPLITEECNVVKATGKVHTYKIIKQPMFNENGEITGISGISIDITEQKALAAKNQEQRHLLDVILDNVDAYVYMKDADRHFRYVNNKVAELFGLPAKDIIGQRDIDVIPEDIAEGFWQTDKQVFESNKKLIINEIFPGPDQTQQHYLSVKIPYDFKSGSKTLIGFSTDVTELYQLKEKFEQLANIDELTGLYNRRYFFDNANREFHRAQRHQQTLAVIAIDVDHFKAINDKYGHPIGDQVLIKMAELLTPMVRAEDILARIGGEEFSILLPNTSKLKSHQAAERLRESLDTQPILINDNIELPVKISLGVSVIKPSDTCFQELYARSDVALYQAKSNGRNHVCMLD